MAAAGVRFPVQRRRLLLLPASQLRFLVLATSLCHSVYAPWSEGAVCKATTTTIPAEAGDRPASRLLQGKHLVVNEVNWPPYAEPNASDPHGWTGMDIDILDAASAMLNFTYEIREMPNPAAGQSWSELLDVDISNADLTASYWSHYAHRYDTMHTVEGHVDLSSVLIADRGSMPATDPLSFMLPFTYPLWGVILSVVFLSGLVDYLMERQIDPETATLPSSLGEYMAGILWGGFCTPLSRMSALYQIMVGFLFVVIMSSCAPRHHRRTAHAAHHPSPHAQHAQLAPTRARLPDARSCLCIAQTRRTWRHSSRSARSRASPSRR